MYPTRRFGREARGYAIGVVAVLISAAIKLAFERFVGTGTLFLLFSVAVLIAAWVGGSMPGLTTTVLAGAVSGYFLVPSRFLLGSQPGDTILLVLFLIEGSLISLAAGRIRSARGGAETDLGALAEQSVTSTALQVLAEDETLDQLGLALGGQLDTARLVEGVTRAGISIAGAAFGAFLYHDASRGWTHFVSGAPPDAFVDFPMSQDPEAIGSPFRGAVCRSDDLTKDPSFGENLPFKRMPSGYAPARSYLAAPVRSRSGELQGGLFFGHPDAGVFRDRDERLIAGLAAHAAIALDNAHLYREAQEARRAAEAASRVKDDFLATLSHELRTPLNAIVGWAHLLKRGQLTPDEIGDAIDTIIRNATAQGQIVEELLDVSRIITGKLQLDLRPMEIGVVVKGSVETVTPAANAKGIRLQLIQDPAGSYVMGDPERLQQVFWNLLSNAIKFTDKHGRVRVSVQSVDSSVEIVVVDSGLGIDAEFLPIIFNRFTQRDSSSTRSARGLGVGLAITRQLVELHGGSIEAESLGIGHGSTFTVRFPRSPVTATTSNGRVYSQADVVVGLEEAPDLRGIQVLIVEDDDDARLLVAKVLEGQGAFVKTVSSAREALEILGRERIDVLLSDIEMPGTDGYQLIRELRLRSQQQGGAVPAVALTAYARTEDRLRALRAGFQLHLSKPVQPSELVTVVASLAAHRNG
ncbi:MAG TPA: ATP-binding protein [Vicinamibacteria bacterium]|nr:ATP-binding protein [Vicinamibacteria bacterium]